jgi:tetratricopeptide (TPR) repeat protein
MSFSPTDGGAAPTPAPGAVGPQTVGLDEPAGPAAPAEARSLGRFEIRRFLGEGGFGRVYEAYDPTLKRVVALKVAKPNMTALPQQVERFAREARAAANLMHPNVVAAFDSGSEGGRYYIAYALVPGRALDQVLSQRRLGLREAVEVVRKLAEALAYAHRQGVIHRDVKPGNVMLRDDGEPMLMDFGLATRLGEEALTITGPPLCTPEYCSPEQARGKATAWSDQYSLGCVLFELLTGQRPFEGGTGQHYLLLHMTQQAPSPRQFTPDLPRDLANVTLRCLEKEEGQRYPDCGALAEDLRRWLAGEPVLARPVGPAERLWRWCRRNPRDAVLFGSVAALVVAVAVVSMVAYFRGEQQRQRAERHLGETVQTVDLLTEAQDRLLEDVPAVEDVQRDYLEKTQNRLNYLLAEKPADPDLREKLALSLYRIGKLRAKAHAPDGGASKEAEDAFRRAIEELEALDLVAPSEPRYRLAVARCENEWAELLRETRPKDAEPHFEHSRTILVELTGKDPENAEYQRTMANLLNSLGYLRHQSNDLPQAAALHRDGMKRLRPLVERADAQPGDVADLARACVNLGRVLGDQGKPAEAEANYREAIGLFGKLGDQPTRATYLYYRAVASMNLAALTRRPHLNPSTALVMLFDPHKVGGTLALYAWRWESQQHLTTAVEILERLHGDFPAYHVYRDRLTLAQTNLARRLILDNPAVGGREARRAEARRRLDDACGRGSKAADSSERHEYQNHLANAFHVRGYLSFVIGKDPLDRPRLEESSRDLKEAIRRQRRALALQRNPEYAFDLVTHLRLRAGVLSRLGDAGRLTAALDDLFRSAREFAGFVPEEQKAGRQKAAADYLDCALTLLEALERMKALTAEKLADPAFNAIRGDPRFRSLLKRAPAK